MSERAPSFLHGVSLARVMCSAALVGHRPTEDSRCDGKVERRHQQSFHDNQPAENQPHRTILTPHWQTIPIGAWWLATAAAAEVADGQAGQTDGKVG